MLLEEMRVQLGFYSGLTVGLRMSVLLVQGMFILDCGTMALGVNKDARNN